MAARQSREVEDWEAIVGVEDIPGWVARAWRASARHARAPTRATASLAGLAAAEAVFFPIPPDTLLAPLAATRPKSAWYFALVTTLASVVGGAVGYLIGALAFETIGEPLLAALGVAHHVPTVRAWFAANTFVLLLLAAFTPIPYKVFTITAGALSAPLMPFLLASFIGRGARFGLVAWLSGRYGARFVRAIAPRANAVLVIIGILVLGYLAWGLVRGY
ncbi:MAG: hypothetical protein KatS3mg100_193 [Candidatus Parcubacteria bacterium]|nr:MAG: hypothetical protein KatS3mg100_193 [Candidatus Parcubacteria bacterium]